MDRKVKWTITAQQQRKDILQYWINSRLTDIEDVRLKVVRDYLIFYEFDDEYLYILSIWDCRQDPNKLKIK